MLPSKIFFDDFFDGLTSSRSVDKMMKCDVYEKEENYIIVVDIPGFKKEDINVELEDGYLKIAVVKNLDDSDNSKNYIRRERYDYTRCERHFYVGNISYDQIKAKFNDGILEITIPNNVVEKEDTKIITIED